MKRSPGNLEQYLQIYKGRKNTRILKLSKKAIKYTKKKRKNKTKKRDLHAYIFPRLHVTGSNSDWFIAQSALVMIGQSSFEFD